MSVYRDDHEATYQLNEHLEREVKELIAERDELRMRNNRLELVARELLNVDPCLRFANRIDELVKENTRLSAENVVLMKDPMVAIAQRAADWEYKDLRRANFQLRCLALCLAAPVWGWMISRLFY